MTSPFRQLPSVSELLQQPAIQEVVQRVGHQPVVNVIRAHLSELRTELGGANGNPPTALLPELAQQIAARVVLDQQPRLREVINATGILLHTGLGRAPLAEEAIAEMVAVSRGYASVELDLASGERSQRVLAVESLLRELTGAEAAAVVNNNAGATLLTLAALAAGREVVVSRGQLVEIGGSFRLPDVMAASGAVLREVGTTNKTRLADSAAAITDRTAALMRVHTSNYRIVGFTAEVPLEALIELGHSRQLLVVDDIGSGALIDFAQFGCTGEPLAAASLRAGADVVLFSGDKLLGGPQCGVIVGKRGPIERISKHPLMRALRVDKLTLAALSATLRLYQNPRRAMEAVPLLRLLGTPIEDLHVRAAKLAQECTTAAAIRGAEAVADFAYLGGGSVPTQAIPTWCVALTPATASVDELAARLRTGSPAIVGRIQRDRLLLDLRSVFPQQDALLAEAIRRLPASP